MWPFKKKDTGPDWLDLVHLAENECHDKTLLWLDINDWNWRLRGNTFIRGIMIAEGIKFPHYDRLEEHQKSIEIKDWAERDAKLWKKREDRIRQEIKEAQSKE